MDDFILSPSDEMMINQVRRELTDWINNVVFLHGISRGFAVGGRQNKKMIPSHLLAPSFDRMSGLWFCHRGNVYFGIRRSDKYNNDDSIFENGFCNGHALALKVFHSSTHLTDPAKTHVSALIAFAVENQVTAQLKGICLKNRLTYCQAEPFKNQPLRICQQVADRWLCDECINKYALAEPALRVADETRAKQKERAKLTPSLRYQILLRDKFTCRLCGRSPSKGDDVRLHVDHVFPIARGGKTEPDNLCTLCQDCNLGKGVSITFKEEK